jgi:hypothetical protein
MSQVIISLRQGSRSTQAPAGSPMIGQGRQADAVMAATATVLACRPAARRTARVPGPVPATVPGGGNQR